MFLRRSFWSATNYSAAKSVAAANSEINVLESVSRENESFASGSTWKLKARGLLIIRGFDLLILLHLQCYSLSIMILFFGILLFIA